MVGKREVKCMTRDEIIKALEICMMANRKCEKCPLFKEIWCEDVLHKEALTLFKAEHPDCKDEPIDACKTAPGIRTETLWRRVRSLKDWKPLGRR